MNNLTVRPAHGTQSVAVRQKISDLGIYGAFVIALVCDDLSLNNSIGLYNQPCRVLGIAVIECVRDFAQMIKRSLQAFVVQAQRCARGRWHLVSN
jgi:hypothetical protein